MTEKEKAEELTSKFDALVDSEIAGDLGFQFDRTTKLRNMKKCALIVVDEINNMTTWVSKKCQEKEGYDPDCTEEFWIGVEIEINKLK